VSGATLRAGKKVATGLVEGGEAARKASKAVPIRPVLDQGNKKMGLEHIMDRHSHNSQATDVSKFGRDVDEQKLRQLIDKASESGAAWKPAERGKRKLDADVGEIVGTDLAGQPTSWIKVVVTEDNRVITAYPVAKPK